MSWRSEDHGKTRESRTEWASGEHRPEESLSRKAVSFGGLGVEGTSYLFPTMESAALGGGSSAAASEPSPAPAEIGVLEQRVLDLQRQEQQDAEALSAARERLPPRGRRGCHARIPRGSWGRRPLGAVPPDEWCGA